MRKKETYGYFIFCGIFLILLGCIWLGPTREYSLSERRKLKQEPAFTKEAVLTGAYMSQLEGAMTDQFPFREAFRSLNSVVSRKIFRKSDYHDLYTWEGYACKMEYPMKESSLKHAGTVFERIYDLYLKDTNTKLYFAAVPDKNYFLGESSGHLTMDYQKFFEQMKEETSYMTWINLTDTLEISDYYAMDIHWRQERLIETACYLGEQMGVDVNTEYQCKKYTSEFQGVYAGQLALDFEGEDLYYLDNETLQQCRVYDQEHGEEIQIYDLEKASGADPYDLFLSGSLSLITIENPNNESGKELVVFRDSFGSSLIPLLAEGYEKITLIDIRYLNTRALGQWVDFEDQDVLFLYSVSVLNNAETLK